MEKKEFKGFPQGVDSNWIINKDNPKDLDDFFLGLGLIFNDIKGVLFFLGSLDEDYKKPKETDEVSAHLGEYGGIKTQLWKLVIAIISEFFVFLRKNQSVVNGVQFQLYYKKLDKDLQKSWKEIYSAAVYENKTDSFFSKIARVRSNITFHYSGEELRSGFIDTFIKDKKNKFNEQAFYSLGSRMEESRFYYCDAAVQAYLVKQLAIDDGDYTRKSRFFIELMNQVIFNLMRIHLKK